MVTIESKQYTDLIICKDKEVLADRAAHLFSDLIAEILLSKETCTVALSGGSTPKLLYERLLQNDFLHSIDWKRVLFFVSDERCVSHDSAESNYGNAFRLLLSRLALPDENLHPTYGQDIDPDSSASDYEQCVRKFVQTSKDGIPSFDIIFLGMGSDGHTASLFPDTTAISETHRLVVKNHVDKLDSERITFTFPLINKASNVIFMVAGADKSEVLSEVMSGPVKYPCQLVKPAQGRLVWILDRAAASRLES